MYGTSLPGVDEVAILTRCLILRDQRQATYMHILYHNSYTCAFIQYNFLCIIYCVSNSLLFDIDLIYSIITVCFFYLIVLLNKI